MQMDRRACVHSIFLFPSVTLCLCGSTGNEEQMVRFFPNRAGHYS